MCTGGNVLRINKGKCVSQGTGLGGVAAAISVLAWARVRRLCPHVCIFIFSIQQTSDTRETATNSLLN